VSQERGLRVLYDTLRRAADELAEFRCPGRLPDEISAYSAFAVGEALDTILKAKSHVGRDLDERDAAKAVEKAR